MPCATRALDVLTEVTSPAQILRGERAGYGEKLVAAVATRLEGEHFVANSTRSCAGIKHRA
jgi:hypothetical protein